MGEASWAARESSASPNLGAVATAWRLQRHACCLSASVSLSATRKLCPAPAATWRAANRPAELHGQPISCLNDASFRGRRARLQVWNPSDFPPFSLISEAPIPQIQCPSRCKRFSKPLCSPTQLSAGALGSLLRCWTGQKGQGHLLSKSCRCEVMWRALALMAVSKGPSQEAEAPNPN